MKIKSLTILALAGLLLTTSCGPDKDLGGLLSESQMITDLQLDCEQNLQLAVGMTKKVSATYSPDNAEDPQLVWESYNKDIATVDNEGLIQAIKVGSATVSIKQNKCLGTLASLNVQVKPVAENIAVEDFAMYEGTSRQLTAVLTPTDAYNVLTWTSSNTDVATVDEEGNINALVPGTTTVTATTTDGTNLSASATVTVKKVVPVESLKLTLPGFDLNIGEKATVKCELIPADATSDLLTWTSSNEGIAIVNGKGEVTGQGYGTTTITATSANGKTASVEITVGEGAYNQDFGSSQGKWYVKDGATVAFDGTCMTYNMVSVNGKYWGDLGLVSQYDGHPGKIAVNVGTYRYIAVKMTRPGEYRENNNGAGTLFLDTSKGRYEQQHGNGNNRYKIWGYDKPADCPMDEPAVVYFDLQSTFGKNGYKFPTDKTEELNIFKFVWADVPSKYNPVYKVYWVHTFKTLDELKAFVENNK